MAAHIDEHAKLKLHGTSVDAVDARAHAIATVVMAAVESAQWK